MGLIVSAILFNKNEDRLNGVLKYSVFGFFAAFIASARLSASNILICLPFVLLLFEPEISRSGKSKAVILAQYFLFGFFYIVYIVFFRSKGIMLM
jgi:hypothetical protein